MSKPRQSVLGPDLQLDATAYVRGFVNSSLGDHPQAVLDVPCGYGRHALWLAECGHDVTGIDLNPKRIDAAQEEASRRGITVRFLVAAAEQPLAFSPETFDAAVIVHYVSDALIRHVGAVLKPNGLLLYETFGGQGRNWTDLPAPNVVRKIVASQFDLIDYRERPAGAAKDRVALKMVARKR